MKILLWISGVALTSFSAMHVFIAFEHWQQPGPHRESVLEPALSSLIAAGLALFVVRLALRDKAST
jgi:hypothetical protein